MSRCQKERFVSLCFQAHSAVVFTFAYTFAPIMLLQDCLRLVNPAGRCLSCPANSSIMTTSHLSQPQSHRSPPLMPPETMCPTITAIPGSRTRRSLLSVRGLPSPPHPASTMLSPVTHIPNPSLILCAAETVYANTSHHSSPTASQFMMVPWAP